MTHKNEATNQEFVKACKPLMDYLRDNHHPHCHAIVTCTMCEISEGVEAYIDEGNCND